MGPCWYVETGLQYIIQSLQVQPIRRGFGYDVMKTVYW